MIKKISVPESPSFLIIKLRALGDVLLSTPVVSTLKRNYPDSRIDYLVLKGNAELVLHNDYIDNVFILDKAWDKLPILKRLKQYQQLKNQIQKIKYDIMFDLQNSPRSIWAGFFARARVKIGYKKPQNFFYNFRFKQLPGLRHNVDDLLYLLYPLNLNRITRKLKLDVPEQIIRNIMKKFDLTERDYVIIHPGAGRRREFKMWNLERFSKITHAVLNLGYNVFIIGGPGDSDLIEELKNLTGHPDRLRYLDNQFSIIELAAFLKCGRLFIGNDSGPLHIADAVGTPCIGIFGASSPVRWGVISPPHINLFKDIGCNPCPKVECIYGYNRCMDAITVDMVEENLKYFL